MPDPYSDVQGTENVGRNKTEERCREITKTWRESLQGGELVGESFFSSEAASWAIYASAPGLYTEGPSTVIESIASEPEFL